MGLNMVWWAEAPGMRGLEDSFPCFCEVVLL